MLKIDLKTSFRKILKEPLYNILNVTAFTLSMSIAFLLAVIIYNQYNFDKHNKNRDQIYRVNTTVSSSGQGNANYATSPAILKELIDTTFFNDYINLVPLSVKIIGNSNEAIKASGYSVDGDYFSFFQIPLIEGDLRTVLSEPSKVAISRELAKKLYKDDKIIGNEIFIETKGNFVISGVFDLSLNKTHLKNDILFSSSINRDHIGLIDSNLYAYDNYGSSYLYVLSKSPHLSSQIDNVFASINKTYKSHLIQNNSKLKLSFFGQSLSDISPRKEIWNENGQAMGESIVLIFITIILVLLSLTVFNYSSVMTSLGLAKSKEIGIRKILGASKRHIILQYISESIIISTFSFLLGVLVFPFISRLSGFQRFTVDLKYDIWIIIVLFVFSLLVGIIAGIIPALSILKFKELDMLNNIFRNRVFKGGLSFRKIIIVIQFSVSMVLILFAYTLFKQTNFMVNANYGFDYSNTLSIKVSSQQEYNIVRDEFSKFKEVNSISFISTNLGYMPTDVKRVWTNDPSNKMELSIYHIDENTIKDLGLDLVDGSNFSNNPTTNRNTVILNQQALDLLEISKNPRLGVNINDSTVYRVIGTVKDFHFQNFKRPISPMAFIYRPEPVGFLNLKIQSGKIDLVQEYLENKKFQNLVGKKLESLRWDDVYRGIQGHGDSVAVIVYLTMTLVVIACLGLIAILSFSIQQRFKEVTIRKIIGANYFQVFQVLTKEYLLLLFISLTIGASIGCFISNEILMEYAYRIKLNFIFLSIPFMLFIGICLSILILTTWKTCRAKPVDNLKNE